MIVMIILRVGLLFMMIFLSHIENKYIFILTFALATPFLRPRDPQIGKPWYTLIYFHAEDK